MEQPFSLLGVRQEISEHLEIDPPVALNLEIHARHVDPRVEHSGSDRRVGDEQLVLDLPRQLTR